MKKKVILIAVNAFFSIAFTLCLVLSASISGSLRSQQAAPAWAGQSGERFAQLSVFFPDGYEFGEDDIRSLHTSIDSALLNASLESSLGRVLYTDAWSASYNVSVIGERGTATAPVIAVGGDFFLFHPLYLRDGGYLLPGDVMKDRVLLDEELAWRLYGSYRLSGLEVMINNKPFVIAGVVSRANDFASSRAYRMAHTDETGMFNGAGMFMSFDALMDMNDNNIHINSYEIVMPDPITGFALNVLTDEFTGTTAHIVENTARFSLGKSFSLIRAFGERSMQNKAIAFPYWENAARFAEDWIALLLVLTLVFFTFPFVCGVIYSIKFIRFGIKYSKTVVKKYITRRDNRNYEAYLLKHGNERQIYDD